MTSLEKRAIEAPLISELPLFANETNDALLDVFLRESMAYQAHSYEVVVPESGLIDTSPIPSRPPSPAITFTSSNSNSMLALNTLNSDGEGAVNFEYPMKLDLFMPTADRKLHHSVGKNINEKDDINTMFMKVTSKKKLESKSSKAQGTTLSTDYSSNNYDPNASSLLKELTHNVVPSALPTRKADDRRSRIVKGMTIKPRRSPSTNDVPDDVSESNLPSLSKITLQISGVQSLRSDQRIRAFSDDISAGSKHSFGSSKTPTFKGCSISKVLMQFRKSQMEGSSALKDDDSVESALSDSYSANSFDSSATEWYSFAERDYDANKKPSLSAFSIWAKKNASNARKGKRYSKTTKTFAVIARPSPERLLETLQIQKIYKPHSPLPRGISPLPSIMMVPPSLPYRAILIPTTPTSVPLPCEYLKEYSPKSPSTSLDFLVGINPRHSLVL